MGVETQRGKGNLIRHPVLAVVLSLSITACLQAAGRRSPSRHVPNEIIIRLRADQPGQATGADERAKRLEKLGARWPIRQVNALARHRGRRRDRAGAGRPDLTRVYRVRLDERADVSVEDVLASYRAQADVEYAELNPIVSICAQPDDPQYGSQWALQKIAAAEAWDTCRGSAAVVVAVIDTGVDYRHRDLEANAWRNRAEFNGAPGVDDDGNGFIDDLWGYNFIYNDNEPMDDHGHGTHCAGTIAAVGNNGLDVSGICWNARIMPIKILGDDGDGNAADAALAVDYAVANGAHVISASWGGPEPSELLEEALAYARSRNVVIVGAAGNEDTDETFYPAGYPQVI
ncbi:MAG: S8 family serine peptidase, partial [Planctomycetota bacterium]